MPGKKRRSADESRAHILEVAARRLREQGLEGLNITGVAEDAGLSHATLIHHFGSSGGMRDALADKMTQELVTDLMDAMNAGVDPGNVAKNVFSALAEGGHAKLLAWRAVEGHDDPSNQLVVRELFDKLLTTTQKVIDIDSREELQRIILLVATAAIGYGIAGEVLTNVMGMDAENVESFPAWVTEIVG